MIVISILLNIILAIIVLSDHLAGYTIMQQLEDVCTLIENVYNKIKQEINNIINRFKK